MKCKRVKNGDYVTRKSYGKDIIFNVEKIIKLSNGTQNAILKGVTYRIKADAPIEDLCIIQKKEALNKIKQYEEKVLENIKTIEFQESKRNKSQIKTGLILHLDGECIILEKIEENAYQAYPIADLSILKLSCINGKNLHFYKKHDNIITKNI